METKSKYIKETKTFIIALPVNVYTFDYETLILPLDSILYVHTWKVYGNDKIRYQIVLKPAGEHSGSGFYEINQETYNLIKRVMMGFEE